MKNYAYSLMFLLVSGCQFEKAPFEVAQVRIKDNAPCFQIPRKLADNNDTLASDGVMVTWNAGGKWVVISPPGLTSEERKVRLGECTVWSDIHWSAGEYSSLMKVNNLTQGDSVRLRSDFEIKVSNNGILSVVNK